MRARVCLVVGTIALLLSLGRAQSVSPRVKETIERLKQGSAHVQGGVDEHFVEELLLRPLSTTDYRRMGMSSKASCEVPVLSHFQFTTRISSPFGSQQRHFRLFPPSLYSLFDSSTLKSFHLRMSTGRWDEEKWGEMTHGEGGQGTIFAAEFDKDPYYSRENNTEETEYFSNQWRKATESVGSLFGVSLNPLGNRESHAHPYRSFFRAPNSCAASDADKAVKVFYWSLPYERPCTENLTPFLKLLPCRSVSGIASLLLPTSIFGKRTMFVSLQVSARRWVSSYAPENGDVVLRDEIELVQTVTTVRDVGKRSSSWNDNEVIGDNGEVEVYRMLGLEEDGTMSVLNVRCPLSDASRLYVQQPFQGVEADEEPPFKLSPLPDFVQKDLAVYLLDERYKQKQAPLMLTLSYPMLVDKSDRQETSNERSNAYRGSDHYKPVIQAKRTLVGRGDEGGGVRIDVRSFTTDDVEVTVFETVPWFLPVYLKSLKISKREPADNGRYHSHTSDDINDMVEGIRLVATKDHSNPTEIECVVIVPAGGVITITYQFKKHLRHWTEYPPDAHLGYELPPTVVSYEHAYASALEWSILPLPEDATRPVTRRVYGDVLHISLPLPDFSMPYNVICLTCTCLAIAFGTILSLMTQRFSYLRSKGEPPRRLVFTIVTAVLKLLGSKKVEEEERRELAQKADQAEKTKFIQ